MPLLAWGTTLAELPGQSQGFSAYTTASRLGPGVAEGIFCGITTEDGYRALEFASAAEIWLSLYYGEVDASSGTSRRYGINFYKDNALRFRWGGTGINNVNLHTQYWNGSAWVTIGSSHAFQVNTVNHLLFHIKLDNASGVVETYINGVLHSSLSGDTIFTTVTDLNNIRFSTTDTGALRNATVYSAIMVADEDISNLMYLQTAINGAGAETAWNGDYTSVDETGVNDADIITSANNGDVETFTKGALNTLYNTYDVAGVGVSARAMKGTTGPQNLQLAARSNSVNGFSASKALTTNWKVQQALIDQNPDTVAPWTFAEASAAEVGVKAIT